ncbi:DDE Tnp4 domain-containing protein [Trichonephila clavipes]|nr:DDE Tnp4 domain-containing protein [Trichonephila clavipes]
MLDLVKKPNYLQQIVEENGWARKRAIWTLLSDLSDFPRLTWKELRYLTLGIYQLKQSESYTHEHLNQSGLCSLYVNQEDSSVVRLKLRLRHTSSGATYTPASRGGAGFKGARSLTDASAYPL